MKNWPKRISKVKRKERSKKKKNILYKLNEGKCRKVNDEVCKNICKENEKQQKLREEKKIVSEMMENCKNIEKNHL